MRLETERLIVREFTNDDLEDLAPIMADKEVMRFSLSGPLSIKQVEEMLKKFILSYSTFGFGIFAVFHKEEQRVIGYAGLMKQSIDEVEKIELGYRLHPKYWGKGLATEACVAICRYAFNQLNMTDLISIIDPRNVASINVAKRVGMHLWKTAVFHGIDVNVYTLKKINLESFQTSWQQTFETEKKKLSDAFKNLAIDFYHIGSTAIPGCHAKPIIDILGVTSDVTEVDCYANVLCGFGYEFLGEYGMEQRRYCRRKNHEPVNLHIFEDTDPEVERHLRFGKYLNQHSEKVEEYSQLKRQLAKKFPESIDEYCLGKEKFIKAIDILAAQQAEKNVIEKTNRFRKQKWSLQEILKAMQVNMHLQMTYFTKYVNAVEVVFQPDVTIVRTEIPDDTFNYVFSANFKTTNVNERVESVLELYKNPSLPFSWWVGPNDMPSELSDVLLLHGLTFKEENVGMFMPLDAFNPSVDYKGLVFHKVESISLLKDFSEVIVNIGGYPEVFDKLYSRIPKVLYQDGTCFEMYVAYLNNVPIVTGILLLHANVGGIYYVATIPEQRKKGYGTAMMEYLMMRAKDQGYHIATLQASKEGKGLYQRLGFNECCLFKEYAG